MKTCLNVKHRVDPSTIKFRTCLMSHEYQDKSMSREHAQT